MPTLQCQAGAVEMMSPVHKVTHVSVPSPLSGLPIAFDPQEVREEQGHITDEGHYHSLNDGSEVTEV
jgi:hypothetical protein